ncbi:MAG: helix-turn-helix domain-containing protein [Xanthomonadales bacterium]|nr:helix-turn-helix domain-containing protein [Xanthomonadales bacterium]
MNDKRQVLMQGSILRKAFGSRVKEMRKNRYWTQKDLANRVNIRFQLLNKYEGGQHIPPADTLIRLAKTLDTTVDYLLTGDPVHDEPLANANLYRRFQTLEALNNEDRTTIISVIDAIIAKRQVENAIKPIDQQVSG